MNGEYCLLMCGPRDSDVLCCEHPGITRFIEPINGTDLKLVYTRTDTQIDEGGISYGIFEFEGYKR